MHTAVTIDLAFFCSDYHLSICSKVFTKLDKNRDAHLSHQVSSVQSCYSVITPMVWLCYMLLLQEVVEGLQEVHYHCLTEAQAQHVLQSVHYSVNMQADLRLFATLCCLAERMYSLHLL